MQGRARRKTIKDQICSMLLLASVELQQLLSAFYLTLTKGANCLAKEEGSLILSCCRQIAQARAKGQEAKGEEEEVMLKVGAAVVQPAANFHSVPRFWRPLLQTLTGRGREGWACFLASPSYQDIVLVIPGADILVFIQAKPKAFRGREGSFVTVKTAGWGLHSASHSPRALLSKTPSTRLKSQGWKSRSQGWNLRQNSHQFSEVHTTATAGADLSANPTCEAKSEETIWFCPSNQTH